VGFQSATLTTPPAIFAGLSGALLGSDRDLSRSRCGAGHEIGGEAQQRCFGVLRPDGVLASTVQPSDEAKAHGVTATFVFHSPDATRLATVVETVAKGTTVLLNRRL
jgi:hypothetical protein